MPAPVCVRFACAVTAAALLAACGGGGGSESLTYYQDIKPILDARCATCHRAGGAAPLPLTTYDEARTFRARIKETVEARTMPPWGAARGCKDYRGDISLDDEEIDALVRWVDRGAPAGDVAAAPGRGLTPAEALAPTELPSVDLTLPMPVAYTPVQSPDDYRCFLLEWPRDQVTYVRGFNVRAQNPQIVHHVIAFMVPEGRVAEFSALDAAEEGPGWTCFGGPGGENDINTRWLAAWAPGPSANVFPEGTGVAIQPGTRLILQMHYNVLSAEPVPDQSSVEFSLTDAPLKPALFSPFADPLWVLARTMHIPAGQPDVVHRASIDVTQYMEQPRPFLIHGTTLHMHTRGTRGRVSILRADGTDECLLEVPQWDFNWQRIYWIARPVVFNPGDHIVLECHWDNTAANQPRVNGEPLPVRDVNWGEGTTDEMCLSGFYSTLP